MMISFRALIRKDLQLFFVDRRALIMSFAIPIAIGSFFGYVLGGQGSQANQSKIAVLTVDRDHSAISNEIVKHLSEERALDVKPSTPDDCTRVRPQGKRDRGRDDSTQFRARRRSRILRPARETRNRPAL